jgi:hypothetical protein
MQIQLSFLTHQQGHPKCLSSATTAIPCKDNQALGSHVHVMTSYSCETLVVALNNLGRMVFSVSQSLI